MDSKTRIDRAALLLGVVISAGCTGDLPEEVTPEGTTGVAEGSTGLTTLGEGSTSPDPTTPTVGEGTGDTGDSTGSDGSSTDTGPECTDEICDGVDNDCDDEIDEGCDCIDGATEDCYSGDPGRIGMGECVGGTRECIDGAWGSCEGEVTPIAEECNGADDDCDGETDEGFGQVSCGDGICMVTVDSCVGGVPQPCMPGDPMPEECNGLDDDCDGDVDEIMCDCMNGDMQACYTGPMGTEGVGPCMEGSQTCMGGMWGACSGDVVPVAEVCGNGIDEDCDGTPDDGCCSQIVLDPSFEGGSPNASWAEASMIYGTPLCTAGGCGTGGGTGARTGNWWGWFGGYDGYELASLEQDLVIPMAATATLSLWLEINACGNTVEDSLVVSIDGMPQLSFDNGDAACDMLGYVEHTVDVSAFADGAMHTVTVVGEVFGSGPPAASITNFFVDDVTIEICS